MDPKHLEWVRKIERALREKPPRNQHELGKVIRSIFRSFISNEERNAIDVCLQRLKLDAARYYDPHYQPIAFAGFWVRADDEQILALFVDPSGYFAMGPGTIVFDRGLCEMRLTHDVPNEAFAEALRSWPTS